MLKKQKSLESLKLPKHLAIIMDGNSRWAKSNNVSNETGYRVGSEVAEKIIEICREYGILYLTLFTFSAENWNRPEKDVRNLMNLLENYLSRDVAKIINNGIRVLFIGDREKLSPKIRKLMLKVSQESAQNSGMTLILAISYGARNQIRNAAFNMLKHCIEKNCGGDELERIAKDSFDEFVNPHSIPDPDLLIRTSGEQRLSNFLLWEMAYTELYFTKKLWPDFCEQDLIDAFKNFTKRQRRYGK
jgi:undecaprenyl diphosphate synthase